VINVNKILKMKISRYEINSVLHEFKYWKNEVLVLDVIEKLNDSIKKYHLVYENNNEENIAKIINEDDLYLTDYECVNGVIRRIKYEPFRFLFKTSGKIIIENDLREDFLNDGEEDDFDINSTRGKIECTQFYADKGLLHGFVGNSCPGVYYSKEEGVILIGAEYDDKDKPILPNDTYKRITSICTDLWWYSICDVNSIKNPERFEHFEITAGTWELEHYYGISELGYHENLPYAKLKLINEHRR
jgi:hypothetical protein